MAAGALNRPPKRARSNSHHGHSINIGSVMLLVSAFVVIGAALMARNGFRGRDHVIGVDLGTTYSVVAISQNNNVAIIPDQFEQILTPSIVAYLSSGEHYVGRRARAYRTIDPKHTFFNAKRFIGRSFANVLADNETDYDFQIDSISAGVNGDLEPCFRVNLAGHPSCVTPVNVGTLIVRHLHDMACRFVGHDQITKAVIAVPVDFNKSQRAATVAVFEAAGLSVSRVLDEPTAAAIAYGLHQDPSIQFIIVFDFGGGTLDVSLLYVRSGSINVVDTMGDNHLGGEDIDAVVAKHLTKLVEQQLGGKLLSTVDTASKGATHQESFIEAEGKSIEDDLELPCTRAGLRRVAEQLKRALSSQETASAACVVVQPDNEQRKTIAVDLTRLEFEALCANLFKRTMLPVQAILDANSMSTTDVDAVVLVGGSTRLPWIRQALQDMFHGRAPLSDIDPDVAVAYGAARTID